MKAAPLHPEEPRRLQALTSLAILDTYEEEAYDDLTSVAAHICGTPIALVSLIDRDRQWFKSHHGLEARETPRDLAFCTHAILGDGALMVSDAFLDDRFADNPLVRGPPNVRFYAGVPLQFNGLPIGTLCVIDHVPRTLGPSQLDALFRLSRQVESQFRLRQTIKALEQAELIKDEFISTVNHELRTPLTSIHGALRLAQGGAVGALSGGLSDLIDVANRNCARLLRVVDEVLDVTALESGAMVLERERTDLRDLLEEAVLLAYPTAQAQDRTLELHVEDRPLLADVDPHRISQVLANLISNAIKFSSHGTIRLVAEAPSGRIRVGVTNHGAGISPDLQGRLFTRFARERGSAASAVEGSGLGLFISRRILQLHDGEIGCICGNETTFWFEVPAL